MKHLPTVLLTLLVLGGCGYSAEPFNLLCTVGTAEYEFEIDTKDSILSVKRRFDDNTFSSNTYGLVVGEDFYATEYDSSIQPRPTYSIDRRTLVLTTSFSVQFECKLLEVKI